MGARAPRAFAAAADATLAAERAKRAAAAPPVAGGRARQPSLHAFFARTTPAAAQKGRAAGRQRAYDEQSEGPGANFEQAATGRLETVDQVEHQALRELSALSACCLPSCRPPAHADLNEPPPTPACASRRSPSAWVLLDAEGKLAARSHD